MNDKMNHNLNIEYYYKKDGELDLFTKFLECGQVPLYFLLKSELPIIGEPYEIFLGDTSFFLLMNSKNQIKDIDCLTKWKNDDIFSIEYIKGRGKDTFLEIQNLLDEGKIVMFETHSPRVPFFRDFIALDYDYNDQICKEGVTYHVFVAVAHDAENLYYLEAPALINRSSHVPFKSNKSIGVIPKCKLEYAFDCFLNYYRVEINKKNIDRYSTGETLRLQVDSIINNFCIRPNISSEEEHYYNNDAIHKLIEIFEDKKITLEQNHSIYAINYTRFFLWKFCLIKNKRVILYNTLLRNRERFNHIDIRQFQENIAGWDVLIQWLNTFLKTSNPEIHNKIKDYLNNVIVEEDQLIKVLQPLIDRV